MTAQKPTPKIVLALRLLVDRPLNKLEEFNIYGDTCFNSALASQHGFIFIRKLDPYINLAISNTCFMRYWLEPSQMKKAYAFISNHSPNADNEL